MVQLTLAGRDASVADRAGRGGLVTAGHGSSSGSVILNGNRAGRVHGSLSVAAHGHSSVSVVGRGHTSQKPEIAWK